MPIRQIAFPVFKVDNHTPLCQLVNWLVCEPRAPMILEMPNGDRHTLLTDGEVVSFSRGMSALNRWVAEG